MDSVAVLALCSPHAQEVGAQVCGRHLHDNPLGETRSSQAGTESPVLALLVRPLQLVSALSLSWVPVP